MVAVMPCWWQAVFMKRASIMKFSKHRASPKCAVVTSYEPGALSDEIVNMPFIRKCSNGKSTEDFEKEIKKKFIETARTDATFDCGR